jgi:hypothetical protein
MSPNNTLHRTGLALLGPPVSAGARCEESEPFGTPGGYCACSHQGEKSDEVSQSH